MRTRGALAKMPNWITDLERVLAVVERRVCTLCHDSNNRFDVKFVVFVLGVILYQFQACIIICSVCVHQSSCLLL
jgi:hypothetical protein